MRAEAARLRAITSNSNCVSVGNALDRVMDGQRLSMTDTYWYRDGAAVVGDYHPSGDSIDISRTSSEGPANTLGQIVQIARHEGGHGAGWNDSQISARMPACL